MKSWNQSTYYIRFYSLPIKMIKPKKEHKIKMENKLLESHLPFIYLNNDSSKMEIDN